MGNLKHGELIEALRKDAALLRHWAIQLRVGGFRLEANRLITMGDPMRNRANEIDELIAKHSAKERTDG